MCGIVGMISKSSQGFFSSDLDMFQNMLVLDSLRGEDSTGVFGIYKNRQAKTVKVAAEPHMLFRCNEWGDFRTKAISSMNILVGHNRYATKGAVTTTNAHPFSEGKIVLVHNGTLHNQTDFNKEVEVDSHAITHALNERPAKDVLKEVDGAFAFVWYDRSEGKLFVARNSERPLSFIETSNNIYFASEGGMLDYLVNRKSAQYKLAEAFPVGKLISFDLKGNREEEDFELFRPKYQGYTKTYKTVTPGTTTTITTPVSADTTPSEYVANGTDVLVKITEITNTPNNRRLINVRGKLLSHHPDIDFSGVLDRNLTLADAKIMKDLEYVQGRITGNFKSTCGKSYFLANIDYPEMVQTYNNKIPKVLWNHLCATQPCDKCGTHIQTQEAGFTSVKRRNKTDKFRVVCSDCIMEALDEKTKPDTDKQSSTNQVQAREPLGSSHSTWPYPKIEQDSIVH